MNKRPDVAKARKIALRLLDAHRNPAKVWALTVELIAALDNG